MSIKYRQKKKPDEIHAKKTKNKKKQKQKQTNEIHAQINQMRYMQKY